MPDLSHAPTRRSSRVRAFVAVALALGASARAARAQNVFQQTNLVSDVPGLARTLDPQLKNPWGLSFSGTGPFWVSDAGTGVSTLYNTTGTKLGLVVTIPGPVGAVPSVPTGQVFNNTGSFALATGGSASFIFAGATGTISAWNGASGTTAVTTVNGFSTGASYTGVAVAGSGTSARLYAANFGNGRVDVFDGSFTRVLPGAFTDPTVPAGYAPFNVQNLGGSLYVTYASKDPITGRSVAGAGAGFVDVFDANGVLQRRLTGNGAMNSPWGLALAPSGFGRFGGALLVGNFGSGDINAFDPTSGALIGRLTDLAGAPIVNDGLWGIAFGNGGQGGDANTLYFAAGINGERDGLFGSLAVVPEPAPLALVAAGVGVMLAGVGRLRRRAPDVT